MDESHPTNSSSQTPIVLFDDGRGSLAPLTDLRPAFAVRTGALRLIDRLEAQTGSLQGGGVVALIVPSQLAGLTREQFSVPVNSVAGLNDAVAINGRCVLPPSSAFGLSANEAIVEQGSGDLIAARLNRNGLESLLAGAQPDVKVVEELPAPAMLSRPWHVRSFRDAAMAFDLSMAPARHQLTPPPPPADFTAFGTHPLYVHPSARLCPACILDLEHGPIWIDAGATVRPGATVIGPAYVGPHSTVIDHATIKSSTAIGPHCKVGGEVGGTIFQGFANKAHEGHLGDSWVGEWANLGAGTTNSNLLNTYGEVTARATPDGKNERTGEQFLGAIIGDHARFAICTRIMTGAVVGTGVMWAGTSPVSGCVDRFAWVTDAAPRDSGRTYRFDKFIEVAYTVMARRGVQLTEAYSARLRSLAGHE